MVPGERAIVCSGVIRKVEDVRLPDAVGIKDERRVFRTKPGNEASHTYVSADFDNRGDRDAGEQVRPPSSNLLFHERKRGFDQSWAQISGPVSIYRVQTAGRWGNARTGSISDLPFGSPG